MASILETVTYLALGIAIGWWIKRRFFAPVYTAPSLSPPMPPPIFDERSVKWAKHADAHAGSLDGSVALTAPRAMIIGPNGTVHLHPRSWRLEDIDGDGEWVGVQEPGQNVPPAIP